MRRAIITMLAVLALGACGSPVGTPTINVGPTQTRAAELAQNAAILATANAPTATKAATSTAVPPPATLDPPTATPLPPTATSAPKIVPTIPPTPTKVPAPPTATTRPPTSTPTPPTIHEVNEVVSVKNWDIALYSVERPGKKLIWSEYGNSSIAVGTWVVAVVRMQNTGKQNFGVNRHDFVLVTAGGVQYAPSDDFGTYGYSEYKNGNDVGGQVPPGVWVTYYIPFDIAPKDVNTALVFNQDTQPAFWVSHPTP